MNLKRSTLIACVASGCLVSFAAGAGVVWAQQQQQPATRREPQFENPWVSVWKSTIMPMQPLGLHRHEHGRALIALTDGELHVVDKNRKILSTIKLVKGTATWLDVDPPGQMHADVNDGVRPIEVIVVQLKKDK